MSMHVLVTWVQFPSLVNGTYWTVVPWNGPGFTKDQMGEQFAKLWAGLPGRHFTAEPAIMLGFDLAEIEIDAKLKGEKLADLWKSLNEVNRMERQHIGHKSISSWRSLTHTEVINGKE